jgi:transcriptional regulator with XRE-family HTH domain
MSTKKELGRRLRLVRFEKGLTLKEVAARCGMSATHISEVERGKTSPTIGALQRISAALGENPSLFVRDESLPAVLLTKAGHGCYRYVADAGGKPGRFEMVGPGIPGGIIQVHMKTIPPGEVLSTQSRIGEMVMICLKGMYRFTIGDDSVVLREGDAIQFRTDDGFKTEVLGDEQHQSVIFYASPVLI